MRVIALLLATLALTSVCADKTYRITGNDGTTAFIFNFNGTEVKTPALNVTVGEILTFRIEAIMNENGPLSFGLSDSAGGDPRDFSAPAAGGLKTSGSCEVHPTVANSWTTTNVSNPCIITWTVVQPADGSQFFYTGRAKAMNGPINVITAAGGSTTPPPSGTTPPPSATTAPPSGTTAPPSGTTAPPKNSAVVIVPGAAAVIIAAINALFA